MLKFKTPLERILKLSIRDTGPISIAHYMSLCMSHPEFGYYVKGDRIGVEGDFITAPEISQSFGEIIGAWLIDLYIQLGSPEDYCLMELGAGKGTLLADILRVISLHPNMLKATNLVILESNSNFIELQKQKLAQYAPIWVKDLHELPQLPTLIISNEFADALPIRQFVYKTDAWFERCIGIDGDHLVFGLSPTPHDTAEFELPDLTPEQDAIIEVAPVLKTLTKQISQHISINSGAWLCIDYGYKHTQFGETFQAISKHAFADPLENPGEVDLTAHVNFETIAKAGKLHGVWTSSILEQGEFLLGLGIAQRQQQLIRKNPLQEEKLVADLERLVSPYEMGKLFKAICLHSKELMPAVFYGDTNANS